MAWMKAVSTLVALALVASCGGSPTASNADALAALRVRGSLIVAIRVAAPAGGTQQDVAHTQKRAFEAAVATALATRILGPSARVEYRELGRDRASLVEKGEADLAMTAADTAPTSVVFSTPYAAGGIVLTVKTSAAAADVRELAGQTIVATTMGETNANEIAQAYFKDKGIAVTLLPVPGLTAAFAALDTGQATALIGDRTGIALLERSRPGAMRILAELARRPYVVAVRKDATGLQNAVNSVLSALISSGEIQTLATSAGFPYEAP